MSSGRNAARASPARVLLEGRTLSIDRRRIGISYSGGGPQLAIELGCALAMVEEGIIPDVVAGVSAGAIAATAHALDPREGRGIRIAIRLLGHVRNRTLKLAWYQVLLRLVHENLRLRSLGDNAAVRDLFGQAAAELGLIDFRIGSFRPPEHPKLLVGATDRLNGTQFWFPEETPVGDALVASSAIPGVFPWRVMDVGGSRRVLVDGGVISNQPISQLALEGCGTIYAIAVGYGGGSAPPPTNAVNNLTQSIWMGMHQSSRLEEEYVRLKIGDDGVIHHIHPEVEIPLKSYDFTPELVQKAVSESASATRAWLHHLAGPSGGSAGRA
jgi:NTE family protein